MKKLNEKELNVLKEMLDLFEQTEYRNTGMNRINGGFAQADMFDYDDDKIDISLVWGEQDMGGGESSNHEESYTLDRKILLLDIPLQDKINNIRD